jgi:putative ABC transport system permease protein
MSVWEIAWGYLWNRKFTTILTVLSVGLAVGLIAAVLTLRSEAQRRFEEEGQAFDLVVGANGSPLQLVLSSVYFMDYPPGNIPFSVYEGLKADTEYVQAAYPIGLGDSFSGFRIVGTTPEIFDHTWKSPSTGQERHPFALASGKRFEKPLEAVVGATVARGAGLELGDQFVGAHGLIEMPTEAQLVDHSDTPYTVVGILEPSGSPFDRAIYVSLESVWHVHEGHDVEPGVAHADEHGHEVSSVLVQLQSPAYRYEYKNMAAEKFHANVAIPIAEIAKLFNSFLDTAKTILLAVGYLVVVISAISIMIGLYLSIIQRRRDLAIMRALGASASEIFLFVIIEAMVVTVMGILSGVVIGKFTTYVLGLMLAKQYGLVITSLSVTPEELRAYATIALVGIVAGILPAWQAYDSDVARDLADRG